MRILMVALIYLVGAVSAQAEGYRSIEEVIKTSKLMNGNELVEMEGILKHLDESKSPPVILFRHDDNSIAFSGVVAGYEDNFVQCVSNAYVLNRQSHQTGVGYICLNRGDYTRIAFSN